MKNKLQIQKVQVVAYSRPFGRTFQDVMSKINQIILMNN